MSAGFACNSEARKRAEEEAARRLAESVARLEQRPTADDYQRGITDALALVKERHTHEEFRGKAALDRYAAALRELAEGVQP